MTLQLLICYESRKYLRPFSAFHIKRHLPFNKNKSVFNNKTLTATISFRYFILFNCTTRGCSSSKSGYYFDALHILQMVALQMHFAVAAVAEEEKAYFPRRSFAVVDTATRTMVVCTTTKVTTAITLWRSGLKLSVS